jgi:hypothetical protein
MPHAIDPLHPPALGTAGEKSLQLSTVLGPIIHIQRHPLEPAGAAYGGARRNWILYVGEAQDDVHTIHGPSPGTAIFKNFGVLSASLRI